MFSTYSFDVLNDNSLVLWARTSYVSGEFGVSANSSLDFTFIKFSPVDRSVQWVTSIDLNNNNDQEISTYVFEGSLYFLLTSTTIEYCIGNFSISDGKIQWKLCWRMPSGFSVPQKLDLIFVTKNWIISTFPDSKMISNRNIIIFESGKCKACIKIHYYI